MCVRLLAYITGKRTIYTIVLVAAVLISMIVSINGETNVEVHEIDGEWVVVEGEIYKLDHKPKCQVIYVNNENGKLLIYDSNFVSLSIGNEVRITGEFSVFEGARNPGNFNAKNYYDGKKIRGYIYADTIIITNPKVDFIRERLRIAQEKGVARLYQLMGEEKGAVLAAMILGDKDELDEIQEEKYQQIGVGHIFAISGLHISILSLFLYEGIRRITGRFWIAGIIVGMVLCGYVILTGVGLSAVRAGVMFGIRVGADISGRAYDHRTSLAMAALCIIVWLPRSLHEGGFLFSFGAILSVIYIVPLFDIFSEKAGKWCEGGVASLGIQLAVLPLMLWNYYEVSPYAVVANMIVIPCMSFLLGIGICGLLGSAFSIKLGIVLLKVCSVIIGLIEKSCNGLLNLPYARLILGKPKWLIIILYYAMLGWLVWKNKVGNINKRKGTIVIMVCTLPLLFVIPEKTYMLEMTMIDVGQGDCIYIKGPTGMDYLIDGGSTDIKEVGKYRIEPFLMSQGVDTLEYVFVSHGDADHINGIEEMIHRKEVGIEIQNLVLCEEVFQEEALQELKITAQTAGITVLEMGIGDNIIEENLNIRYLAPLSDYSGELGNGSSMILGIEMDGLDVLCTGDVEGEGEKDLVEVLREEGKTYEVLKVPHHGSESTSSEEFLEYVQPKIALISAGVDSIYGHPHKEAIQRVQQYTEQIYTTSSCGAISLKYDGKNIEVIQYV